MIFNYLKYLSPIWYFNLKPTKDYCYFPSEEQLKNEGFLLEKDTQYVSETAQIHDLGWSAFQSGFIVKNARNGVDVWQKYNFPCEDEYRFLRKNFHKAWVLYVFLFRIVTLNNPYKEFRGFLKTRKVNRVDYSKNVYRDSNDFKTYESELLKSNPFISVVIPTLNRYKYLAAVFKDLENQTYKNFEVIVVDQTDDFKEDFYKGWNLDIKFWHQKEKALWKARNEAIKFSKGDFILMSEDDIRFNSTFIENHIKTIDCFNCHVSCGVFFPINATIPKEKSFFKFSEQFATGNAMFNKSIIKEVGYFDLQFEKQRMGDGEYGLRCYLAGIKLISNPFAFCLDVKAPSGGLRQMGSWDGWRPKKLFGPRPVPSVLYLSRKYFGNKFSIYFILKSILPSLVPYKYKSNKFLKIITFLFLPFVFPLVLTQVFISWRISSEMLVNDK